MNKEQIYKQIEEFYQYIKNTKETKTNKFYYLESKEADIKAKFVKYILKEDSIINKRLSSVENIMDLCYGSGNFVSHILLENNITFKKLYLNDLFLDDCNKKLKDLIGKENVELLKCNFFEKKCFQEQGLSENSIDLLLFNPTHGGKPSKKDFVSKENKNFNALNKTLEFILKKDAIVLFRGLEEDFNQLIFSKFLHQRIFLDNNQSLYICYSYENEDNNKEDKKCYNYKNNLFIENSECKKIKNQEEEIESFDDIDLEFNNISSTSTASNIQGEKYTFSKEEKGSIDFPYKNILFKGVPGTGKSRAVDRIIKNQLKMDINSDNVLRVNIHSASSNADLMQGIGISSNGGQIEYKEKQGLVMDLIKRATFRPNQPFVLVLEEIQENSLNELIGDLIYLIEDSKRADVSGIEDGEYSYQELIEKAQPEHFVKIPYLVSDKTEYRKMILPKNLYVFCTSNYRDDKKVIEDNLLRRFEVIEIYPDKTVVSEGYQEFFESLNSAIREVLADEIHPDRYMIGHAIWRDLNNNKDFYRAYLKLIIEFKDIREIEFQTLKDILQKVEFPEGIDSFISGSNEAQDYFELISKIQNEIDYKSLWEDEHNQ